MKKRKIKIIAFFFAALFFFTLVFSFALAQDRELEVKYPEILGFKPETVKTLLPEYAKYIFNFGLAVFGIVVFGVLLVGGFRYITSTGDLNKLTDAKNQIASAFLGIVILLLSYIILTTINPQLVMFEIPYLSPVAEKVREPLKFEGKEVTLISIEIPLGQMIENGIWKKEEIEKSKKLLDEFELFLKTDRISDLNKYLKGLTEDCQCGALTARCTKPEDWGTAVDCTGDPCKDTRGDIDKILEINVDKTEQLEEYRKKIDERYASSTEETRKFLKAYKEMQECLERGDILNLNEYLAQAQFYDDQGWKTITIPGYIPSRGDPLTFYCSMGGTVFDPFQTSPVDFFNIPEEPSPTEMTAEGEMMAYEPLSCPAEIPVGKILDEVGTSVYSASADLEELMINIDILIEKLRDMDKLISQCKARNCEANCACLPNPCYRNCAPPPNPCLPACSSPCIQTIGGGGACAGKNPDAPYRGSPCSRDDIEETARKIEIYEDEIFSAIERIKENFSYKPYVLETSEGPADLLNAVRAVTGTCFSKNTEEPTWMMLDCATALGSYGPDEEIIADCSPQSFFCCTADKKAAANAKKTLPKETQETTYSAVSEEVFPPSKYGKNNVPYFAQNHPHPYWADQGLGNCSDTIAGAGCRLTSISMVLKYYGANIDPGDLNKWMRKNSLIGGGCSMKYVYGATSKAFGVKLAETFRSNSAIVNALKAGKYPIVVGFVGGVAVTGSRGQHWIVLTGIDKDYVYKNDPIYKRGIRGIPIEVFLRTKGLKRGEFLTK